MGFRVHVISKRAEYGDSEAFNWANEEFKDLLRNLGCTISEDSEDGYSSNWETLVSGYEIAMGILEKMANGDSVDGYTFTNPETDEEIEICEDDVKDSIKEVGYENRISDLLDTLRTFYNERDKNCDWIMFSAW